MHDSPQFYLRDVPLAPTTADKSTDKSSAAAAGAAGAAAAGAAETGYPITAIEHPHPEISQCSKELVRYTRSDGVELTAQLFLPLGYEDRGAADNKRQPNLPVLLWAVSHRFDAEALLC